MADNGLSATIAIDGLNPPPKAVKGADESSHSRSARPDSVALTRDGENQLRVAKLATQCRRALLDHAVREHTDRLLDLHPGAPAQ